MNSAAASMAGSQKPTLSIDRLKSVSSPAQKLRTPGSYCRHVSKIRRTSFTPIVCQQIRLQTTFNIQPSERVDTARQTTVCRAREVPPTP